MAASAAALLLYIINDSGLIFIRSIFKNDTQSILNLGNINTKKESKSKYERYIDNRGVLEDEIPPKEERCDFSYLDSLIHNEDNRKEIFLKKDIRFGNYEIDYYEGGIDLDMDGLVIDGKGNTIYGDGKSRIFIISGENITIKNINFNQGFSSKTLFNVIDGGGLIKINSKSNVNFENCTFEYGFSQEEGGAIHNNNNSIISFVTRYGNMFDRLLAKGARPIHLPFFSPYLSSIVLAAASFIGSAVNSVSVSNPARRKVSAYRSNSVFKGLRPKPNSVIRCLRNLP